jgi:hypothetical protein
MTTHMSTQKSAKVPVSSENPFLKGAAMNINLSPFVAASPFAARSREVPENAPEGSYTYELVPSGPALSAEECERDVETIEIVARWGTSVLAVSHLTPPRSFFIGERSTNGKKGEKGEACDFFMPEEKLGVRRAPILVKGASGEIRLVIPANATGSVTLVDARKTSLATLRASAAAVPSTALAGACEIVLARGAKAEIEIAGVTFAIAAVNAGRAVAGNLRLDGQSLPFQGLSLLIHAGLLAATALFVPKLAMAEEDGVSDEQRYMLATQLAAIAEREPEKAPDLATTQPDSPAAGGTGAQAMGDAGKMGAATSAKQNGRWAQEGPKDNTDVRLSRAEALQQAQDFGIIGMLRTGAGSVGAPVVAWGREDPLGNDPKSALGNMWGQTIDEAGGAGGLALTGVGEGGGGMFEGIGLGRGVDTVGHGAGFGPGSDFGNGRSRGLTRGGHTVKSPSLMKVGDTNVSGRLPSEVIQRVVRQNFGRFKFCYENGLRGNPSLQGRVGVRFVIGRDGSVMSAESGGSDLPDGGVVSCVTRAFYGLSFPQPDNGIVTVSYPIVFSPSN